MNCKIKWTLKFLLDVFGSTWVNSSKTNSYRAHLKNVALERERSKIPETLANLPLYKAELKRKAQIKDLQHEVKALQEKTRSRQYQLRRLMVAERRGRAETGVAKPTPAFLCPCPTTNCQGLIAAASYTCPVCDAKVCRRCRAIPEEKHECNSDDIETVKLLRSDTKPCPTCATPIFKISGCDQMWCTQCQTAFSWRTGELETGSIHNPHAIRWQRTHGSLGRNLLDVPCGGLVPMHLLGPRLSSRQYGRVARIHRRIAELEGRYGLIAANVPNRNFDDLRKDFVLKIISEEKFKQSIFLRERTNARKQQTHDILRTLQTLAVERFRHLLDGLVRAASTQRAVVVNEFYSALEEVRVFINQTFEDELPPLGSASPLWIDPLCKDIICSRK